MSDDSFGTGFGHFPPADFEGVGSVHARSTLSGLDAALVGPLGRLVKRSAAFS